MIASLSGAGLTPSLDSPLAVSADGAYTYILGDMGATRAVYRIQTSNGAITEAVASDNSSPYPYLDWATGTLFATDGSSVGGNPSQQGYIQ